MHIPYFVQLLTSLSNLMGLSNYFVDCSNSDIMLLYRLVHWFWWALEHSESKIASSCCLVTLGQASILFSAFNRSCLIEFFDKPLNCNAIWNICFRKCFWKLIIHFVSVNVIQWNTCSTRKTVFNHGRKNHGTSKNNFMYDGYN